jgi:hypothetical protein
VRKRDCWAVGARYNFPGSFYWGAEEVDAGWLVSRSKTLSLWAQLLVLCEMQVFMAAYTVFGNTYSKM